MNLIRDTIEDMDIETEGKLIKKEFVENKIGLPDCEVFEETKKLDLIKISSRRKGDKIMDRINNSLNSHDYIKNKKQ